MEQKNKSRYSLRIRLGRFLLLVLFLFFFIQVVIKGDIEKHAVRRGATLWHGMLTGERYDGRPLEPGRRWNVHHFEYGKLVRSDQFSAEGVFDYTAVRHWELNYDWDNDGKFTVTDFAYWGSWLYYYFGDWFVVYVSLIFPSIADYLDLMYGQWFSAIISFITISTLIYSVFGRRVFK